MTHIANHKQFGEGFGGSTLDLECEDCKSKIIGNLDDKNFQLLMGLTRQEFEEKMIAEYDTTTARGMYNFWYAIMGYSAIAAFARKRELSHRIAESGSV